MINPAIADVLDDAEPLLSALPVKDTDADAIVDDEATELNEDDDDEDDDEDEDDEDDDEEDEAEDDDEDVDDEPPSR